MHDDALGILRRAVVAFGDEAHVVLVPQPNRLVGIGGDPSPSPLGMRDLIGDIPVVWYLSEAEIETLKKCRISVDEAGFLFIDGADWPGESAPIEDGPR